MGISRELLKYIPNSILLHGGNIYRAIVYSMMNLKPDLKNMMKLVEKGEFETLKEKANELLENLNRINQINKKVTQEQKETKDEE